MTIFRNVLFPRHKRNKQRRHLKFQAKRGSCLILLLYTFCVPISVCVYQSVHLYTSAHPFSGRKHHYGLVFILSQTFFEILNCFPIIACLFTNKDCEKASQNFAYEPALKAERAGYQFNLLDTLTLTYLHIRPNDPLLLFNFNSQYSRAFSQKIWV